MTNIDPAEAIEIKFNEAITDFQFKYIIGPTYIHRSIWNLRYPKRFSRAKRRRLREAERARIIRILTGKLKAAEKTFTK